MASYHSRTQFFSAASFPKDRSLSSEMSAGCCLPSSVTNCASLTGLSLQSLFVVEAEAEVESVAAVDFWVSLAKGPQSTMATETFFVHGSPSCLPG